MDSDDVIDYMVMEAVALKAGKQEQEAQERQKHKDWKGDKAGLDKLRSFAG